MEQPNSSTPKCPMALPLAMGLLLFVITTIPHLYWLTHPDTQGVFVGYVGYHVGDLTNLGWLNQALHGHSLLTYLYDTGPLDYSLVNLQWMFLGWIGRLLRLPLLVTFHLGRLISTVLLVGIFGWWVVRRVSDRWARRMIIFFFCFSGGFGWIQLVVSRVLFDKASLPYDILSWMYPFSECFVTCHSPLSQAMVLLSPILIHRATLRGRRWDYLVAGLPAGALGWFHTYQVPTICFGALLYFGFLYRAESRKTLSWWFRRFVFFVPAVLTTGYMVYLRYTIPACRHWSSHVVEGPSLWTLPIYLGPVLLITLLSAGSQFKYRSDPSVLAVGCFLTANLVLLYSPITFPWIGNADLALFGLWLMWLTPCIGRRWSSLRDWCSRSRLRPAIIGVLFFASFGSSALLWTYRGWVMPSRPDYKIPHDLYGLLQKIDDLTAPSDVLVAEPGICTMIPAFADSRSLFGDASNTVAYAEKRKTIEDLIKNPSPERMIEIADLYNITAWIVGPTPLPLPNSWTKVDSFGDYAFVRVKRNTTRSEDLSASDQ